LFELKKSRIQTSTTIIYNIIFILTKVYSHDEITITIISTNKWCNKKKHKQIEKFKFKLQS